MNRRIFLQSLFGGAGIVAGASLLYPLVRYLSPRTDASVAVKLTVTKSDIPFGSAKEIFIQDTPAIIINRPRKGFIVLSKVCTHLGCLVNYDRGKERLICPCHAGVYDLEGNVVSGFPPKPLPQFPFKVEGDSLVIG